jgi:hypothetical protein
VDAVGDHTAIDKTGRGIEGAGAGALSGRPHQRVQVGPVV